MTTDKKLLDCILESGKEQAEEIVKDAEKKASAICENAKKDGEILSEEIISAAEKKATGIKKGALSAAALTERNAVLKEKRKEIEKTIDGVLSYILEMDDKSYFELIYKMASSVSGKGEILFNERDFKRCPKDFESKIKKAGLDAVVSSSFADINGGFILKDGDIEINCSFDAIVEDKRNDIEDFINSSLFKQEEV